MKTTIPYGGFKKDYQIFPSFRKKQTQEDSNIRLQLLYVLKQINLYVITFYHYFPLNWDRRLTYFPIISNSILTKDPTWIL